MLRAWWVLLLAGGLLSPVTARAQCTNCTTTTVGGDIVLTFTQSGTFTPPAGVTAVRHLVIGGGGGGGGITNAANVGGAGGGGAGGVQSGAGFGVTPLTVYPVTVGAGGGVGVGGTGPGGAGGSSSFSTITAVGGGGGGSVGSNNGVTGGSGGGGRLAGTGAAGTQGNGGGDGAGGSGTTAGAGGGGGAGAVGADGAGNVGGAGGNGASDNISGAAVTYAGGGGGGGFDANGGSGGAGGGGAAPNVRGAGVGGTNGFGGGGGGAGGSATGATAFTGGAGGSGIVVIRYSLTQSQTMSPQAAADCTSLGGGGANWTTPGNAASSNNADATASVDGTTTRPLQCLDYRFTIPLTATIIGIEVFIERASTSIANGGSRDASVFLVKAGAAVGANRATATIYTTADIIEGHGTSSDLWGTTWTPAQINAANFGTVFTATKPSAAGAAHTVSVDHIFITVHYTIVSPVVTPGGFNAYETSTAGGAITGVIRTKVSGTVFNLDVIALSVAKTAILTSFTGTVRVEVVDASSGGAPDTNGCVDPGWGVVYTVSPDPTFVAGDNGRKTVSFTVPNSYRNARVRIVYLNTATYAAAQAKGCSTDNFAVRPSSFVVAVSDATWSTAGSGRTLNNTAATGAPVHKAGQPFRITVAPSPGTATSYDGSPTVSALACTLPGVCANGTLAIGAFTGTGTRVSDTASYGEAGAFNLTLVDQTYASVDAADGTPANCSATGLYVCQSSAPLAVGRFVPDHFAVTAVTQPVFRTFDATDASCSVPPSGPRRSFTYIGQPFGYQTSHAATITAQNAANGTTTNYRGATPAGLWKLTNASASQTFANSPVMTMDITQINASTVVETPNTGTGTLTANAADKLAFTRDNTNPQAQFNANLSLTVSVSDASEAGANQGTITTTTSLVFNGGGAGIAFDAGAAFRYGRLRLSNANGSQLLPLPVPVETQFWNGTAFITNAADHCTTLAGGNIEMSNPTGGLAPVSGCATSINNPITFASGRGNLRLSRPTGAPPVAGSVILTPRLDQTVAAGPQTCVAGSGLQAVTGANRTYLQGNWTGSAHTQNPTARATFGVYKGAEEIIYFRENF